MNVFSLIYFCVLLQYFCIGDYMALHSPKDSVTLRDSLLHLTIAIVPATGEDRGVSPLELCTSPFSEASHSVSGAFGD